MKMRLSLVSLVVSIISVALMVTAINGSEIEQRETRPVVIRPTISHGYSKQNSPRSIQLNLEANQKPRSETKNSQHSYQTPNHPRFQSSELHSRSSPLDQDFSRHQSSQQPQRNTPTQFSTSTIPSKNGAAGDLLHNQQLKQDSVRTFKSHQEQGPHGQPINQQNLYNINQRVSESHDLSSAGQQGQIQIPHYNDRHHAQTQQVYNVKLQVPSQQHTYNTRVQSNKQQKEIHNPQSLDQQEQIYNTRLPQLQQENLHNARQQSNEQQSQLIYNSRHQSPDQNIGHYNDEKQFSGRQQQLYNARQQSPNGQQGHLFNTRQHSENQQKQIINPRQQFDEPEKFYNSHQQPQGNQKHHNTMQQSLDPQQQVTDARQHVPQTRPHNRQPPISEQKQYYTTMQQSQDQQQIHNARYQPQEQLKIYSNMQTLDIGNPDVRPNNFKGASIGLSQVRTESPIVPHQDELIQFRSKDMQNARKDIQAIENQKLSHPLAPINSATVEVSDLRNLNSDMANSGEHIPTTHEIANGRDETYRKSASLSQHLKTPYARYEYSHTL